MNQVELVRYVKALKLLSLGLRQLERTEKEVETVKKVWEYYAKIFRAIKKDIDVEKPRLYLIQSIDNQLEKIKVEIENLFYTDKKEYKHFQYLRKFFTHLEASRTFFDVFAKTQDDSVAYIRSERLGGIDEFDYIEALEIKRRIDEEIKECDKRTRWRHGIVYLLGNEQVGFLKIGCTMDLEQRFRYLQSNSAYFWTVIKAKEGYHDRERIELLKAKRFRIHGELFVWDRSIIEGFDD